jgi:tRNA G46 methylase TrmB
VRSERRSFFASLNSRRQRGGRRQRRGGGELGVVFAANAEDTNAFEKEEEEKQSVTTTTTTVLKSKQRQRDHRKRNRARNKEKNDEVVREVLERFLQVLKPLYEEEKEKEESSSKEHQQLDSSFRAMYNMRQRRNEEEEESFSPPPNPWAMTTTTTIIDWSRFPKSADPARAIGTAKKTSAARGVRKRKQIEQIYEALRSRNVLGGSDGSSSSSSSSSGSSSSEHSCGSSSGSTRSKKKTIVDFGCGTGNLLLALAFLFPEHDFIGVDLNETSIRMLDERIESAKLTNVRSKLSLIETFDEDFDVALALHVCGKATDVVLQTCVEKQKDFACVPCCVGKVQANGHRSVGGMRKKLINVDVVGSKNNDNNNTIANEKNNSEKEIRHPRSNLMRAICDEETFMEVAKLADWSGNDQVSAYEASKHSLLPREAKSAVELDRLYRCVEKGYPGSVELIKLDDECGLRNDLILGHIVHRHHAVV